MYILLSKVSIFNDYYLLDLIGDILEYVLIVYKNFGKFEYLSDAENGL